MFVCLEISLFWYFSNHLKMKIYFLGCGLPIALESRATVLKVWSLGYQHQHKLGICWKCKSSGHTPDLPNQKLQVCGPPGDFPVSCDLRTSVIKEERKTKLRLPQNQQETDSRGQVRELTLKRREHRKQQENDYRCKLEFQNGG